ncbi:MAG: hypothetical protein V3571_09355 [Pseudodesulfovibrio sp.]
MSVSETAVKPEPLAHFPDGGYRWLVLHCGGEPYGHAAIAGRGADLELHLSLSRWGPSVRRRLRGDLDWLAAEARRLGLRRILGVRIDGQGRFSPELFRFASLYGFTQPCVLQTVALDLSPGPGDGKNNG